MQYNFQWILALDTIDAKEIWKSILINNTIVKGLLLCFIEHAYYLQT